MSIRKLIIIGASGHGKVVANIAEQNGYKEIIFLDNNSMIKECAGYPVLGIDTLISSLEGEVFIAVGNANIRKMLMNREAQREFPVLIHPNAVVAADAEIGKGSVIMAGAVINPGSRVGGGCIVNTCASIDHDCKIEDYVHISVGAHLCGNVGVGEMTWIGAGAVVSNNVNICSNCMIGAGGVVIKDIRESGTYVGVPCKIQL